MGKFNYDKLLSKYKFDKLFSNNAPAFSRITAQKQQPVMRASHLSSLPFSNPFNTNKGWMKRKTKLNRMNRKNDWDFDGIPNKLDCQPRNVMRQDTISQSLFYAGNSPPSGVLKALGRVYGFTRLQDAQLWKRKHAKKDIYQFQTSNFAIDPQKYSRQTDTEYIAYNVIKESKL